MKYVYKIISAICSILILPAMFFSPTIYYHITSVALQGILTLAQMWGSKSLEAAMKEYDLTQIPDGIADTLSVSEVIKIINRFSDGEMKPNEKLEFLLPSLYVMIAAFALIAICAVVTAVLAIACKDNRKVIASSIAGVGFSWFFMMTFEAFVAPIVSGQLDMSAFIEAFWASFIAQVEEVSLAPMFYMIPCLFGFVALWTILYNATLPEKEKAKRMKMIG